tara:strand:+ start:1255 stop:2160 length:906 start_codon:yes stop_codon:yes gene_type:complete
MPWKKLGIVFDPRNKTDWIKNYSWVPIPEHIGNGLFRVYFSGRTKENLSVPGAITIDIQNPFDLLDLTKKPLLELGNLGSFDDSGVIPSWILNHDGRKYMFYSGWMQGKRIPFHSSIGLAISDDDGKSFSKVSSAPYLPLNDIDPYFTASCCVFVEGGKWRMWYTSNTRWEIINNEATPKYHIKYAESDDGISWERLGVIAIDFNSDEEIAITRPWIIKEDGIYKMWFTYRGLSNKIGYAESPDGLLWERMKSENELDVSDTGCDSEMVSYGAVVEYSNKKYMFYNGNNYGETGIALAVFE